MIPMKEREHPTVTQWMAMGLILLQSPLPASSAWAPAPDDQESAVKAIEEVGGRVTYNDVKHGLTAIEVTLRKHTIVADSPVTDSLLREVARLPQLQTLSLMS